MVNGTTNYILTRMEEGLTYEEALREAQKLGYAEADPTLDVEGWDAAIKAVILANVIMGPSITIKDVEREGITRITTEDIKKAREEGCRIKLVAEVSKNGDNVKASVRPRKIPLTHPLANVMGVTNALTLETDHLGLLTIVGPGAGRIETGQAILSDILAIHRYISLGRV
ncbi:MAG: homoserine dehydrogenase [Desulfurococcaceae archaeon]